MYRKIRFSLIRNVILILVLNVLCFAAVSQPVVVTQPQDSSICVEASASFSIVSVNTSGYQWQEFDGVGWYNLDPSFTYVNGETTPILSVNDANLALNGYLYRCVVNDLAFNRDTSQPAVLGVYEPPFITGNPMNRRVCKSDITVFDVDAINGSAFQWQEYNGVGWLDIENNSFYSGAQTADLSVYTVLGMDGYLFRCIVTNVSCPDTSETALLNVDPTPILFSVTGGGSFCEDGEGIEIGLNGSEIGISYNLLLDGVETGIVEDGTGAAISFGNQINQGTYTVNAYNQFTSCEFSMPGEALVEVQQLPIDIDVMGGGEVCFGGPYPDIYLLSSEPGILYSLYHNSQNTGKEIIGTGYGISFGEQSQPGFYTVIAQNVITGCNHQMSGSAEVIVHPLPIANAGPDHSIVQGSSADLQGAVSGGSGNYSYSWSPSALCISPTTVNTQSNPLYQSTIFEFKVTDQQNGCVSLLDSAIVYVSSGPLGVVAYASQNEICFGESTNLIAIGSGGNGNYTYSWSSSPPGFGSASSSVAVSPEVTTNYTVEISDGLETVISTVTVTVFPLPNVYAISGGGNYCENDTGADIELNGSETGVRYSLYRNQGFVSDKTGTGLPLIFSNNTDEGTYTITAKNEANLCSSEQVGSTNVGINELPIAEAGPNNLINAGTYANLSGSASGGSGGYTYSWTPAHSLINPTSPDPSTVSLYSTTMFNLTVTDNSGCTSAEDNTIVFVSGGQIDLNILTSGFPVCPQEEVQLFAMASGGSGSFTYFWQSSPSGFTSTTFDPIVNPEETTTYTVTVNDGLTVISKSITVIVNQAPTPFQMIGGGTVCSGQDPQNIYLQGSNNNTEYELYHNGSNTGASIAGNGFALDFGIWLEDGEYTIYAHNYETGCANYMTGSVQVLVNDLPVANAGPDLLVSQGSSVNLSGYATGGSGSYNYYWEPSYLCLSPNNQNTSTIPISQTSLFTLSVTDIQTSCTSLKDTSIIFVQGDNFYVTATASPSQICIGEEVRLSAIAGGGTGNYTYSWTSEPSGFYSSNVSPMAFPQANTSYFLKVFDGLEYVYDTVDVIVNPLPIQYLVTGGGGFCVGDDGVPIDLSSSQPNISYSLYRSPDIFVKEVMGTGTSIAFGTFVQQGSYYCIGVNNQSCARQMIGNVEVTINPLPVVNAGQDIIVSYGEQTVLDGNVTGGSGNYSYSWTPPDSLVVSTILNPLTKSLFSTTQFGFYSTDNETGCESNEDNVVVFVSGGPFSLQAISSKPSICVGEETQLFAMVSGGSGNYSYIWTSDPPGFNSTVYNPVVSPAVSTTFFVSVSDGSTILNDQVTIEVEQLPVPFIVSGGGSACAGGMSDNIVLASSEPGSNYQLLVDGQLTGNDKQGTGFPLNFGGQNENGTYTVHAYNNTSLCENQMAGNAIVTIMDPPVVNAGTDKIVPKNSTTTLSGSVSSGSGSYNYLWNPVALCQTPYFHSTTTNPLIETTMFSFTSTDLLTTCSSHPDTVIIFTSGGELTVDIVSEDNNICMGGSVQLTAIPSGGSGTYSYNWYSHPPGFISTQMNPNVTPAESVTYFVDVFDGVDYVTDSVFINVNQFPNIYTVTGGGTYCEAGSGVEIFLNGSDHGVVYRLVRFPDIEVVDIIGTGVSLSFGNITVPGEYSVIANPGYGCNNIMNGTAIVEVVSTPVANAGDDKNISWLGQVQLSGSAIGGTSNYIYNWTPADSLVNPQNNNPLTIPLHNTTLFNLNVTDSETGCIGTDDQAVVYVAGGPLSVEVVALNDLVCEGEETQLFALPSGGSGAYSYLWLSDPPGFSSNISNPNIVPDITRNYTVIINDGTTTVTDSMIINVIQSPDIFNLIGGGSYCEGGDGIEIKQESSQPGVSYELFSDFGTTGTIIPGSGDTIDYGFQQTSGHYWVVATNNNLECSSVMADTVEVVQSELPISNAGDDQIIDQGTSTQLFGSATTGSGFYNYNWFPQYLLTDPYAQNPQTEILNQTSLFNMFVNDNETGCIGNADTVIVYISNTALTIDVSSTPESVCEGKEVSLSVLPGGGTGNYSYSWTSNPMGFYSNEQFPIDFPDIPTTYIVEVDDGDMVLVDSVIVEVIPSPYVFEVTGGGSYCLLGDGIDIGLSGSQHDIEYTLVRDHITEVQTLTGTGAPLIFGNFKVSGTYTVKAGNSTTSCSAQMAGSAIISQYPQPIADAGDDIVITSGEYAKMDGSAQGGSGAYTYIWTPSEKLLNPNDPDASTIALNSTTLFTLKVTDSESGCASDGDNMVVYVSGGPLNVNIVSSQNKVCPGDQLELFALPGGGQGNYTYYWESIPAGFTATSAFVNVMPAFDTWYKITVHDGNDYITDSIFIETFTIPAKYNLLGGGGFCPGSDGVEVFIQSSQPATSYFLYHNAQYTGQYINGTGGSVSFGNIITEGNYSVEAKNSLGCKTLMNNVIQVELYSLPEKYQLYGGGEYCDNDPTLGLLLESSEENVKYELFIDADPTGIVEPGTGLPISFGSFTGTGNYSVVGTGIETGCISPMLGVAGLIINESPEILITGEDQICSNESIELFGSGAITYEWNTNPPQYNPVIKVTPEATTTYTLAGYNNFGCSDSAMHQVFVNESLNINLTNNEVSMFIVCEPDTLDQYVFQLGDAILQTSENNSWYYGDIGILSDTIMVTAYSKVGCVDSASMYVELKEAPNAFTPNGDGKNDRFMTGHEITIFSSWGGELYHGSDGWDGNFNGKPVVPGTYYYIYHVYDINGNLLKTLKGSVTVVRE